MNTVVPASSADALDEPLRRSAVYIPAMKLDEAWYLARHASQLQALPSLSPSSLLEHFRAAGDALGADPNPCFLLSHYMAVSAYAHRDPRHAPCEDYIRNAGPARWSAHWLFDEERYQALYPKVADAVQKRNLVSGYMHYLGARNSAEFSPHRLFNAAYYAEVAGLPAGTHAYEHFLRVGQFEGLSPHPLFDAEFYLEAAGVTEAIGRDKPLTSALHHFITRGQKRDVAPIADFDAAFYLDRYPDVAEAVRKKTVHSAFQHFLESGQAEGRQPNPFFSEADYLWYNPEVGAEMKAAGLRSAFEHFMAFGARRGLRAHRPAHAVPVPELHAKAIFEQRARITAQLALHEGLALPEAAAPRISFVIPVHDNFAFTVSLLAQLEREARAAPDVPLEAIVVDNGSSDRTRQLGALVGGVRVIRSEARSGYTIACNTGAAAARGEVLVFLNNDIELTPGLVPRILRALADPAIGVAGARIVNAAGQLQEAGSHLWRDGSAAGLGRGMDPTLPIFLAPRDVDYVSGCFLCVRRALFEELGGFDERFSPGYYEDTDFCLQVRARGLRVAYDPTLVIYHYEYASYSKGRPPSSSTALMARKKRSFVEKNRALLARQPAHGDTGLLRHAFPPDAARPRRVLLVEDRVPDAAAGSGFTRSADVLRAMTAAGLVVSVWSLHQRVAEDLPDWTQGAAALLPHVAGPQSVAELLQRQGDEFDVVWVCRTHNFRALRRALLDWRNARGGRRLVVDTEALAAVRSAGVAARSASPPGEEEILAALRGEAPELGAADAVLAVNGRDAAWLDRAFGLVPSVLGHRFVPAPQPAGFAERSGLLFVGAMYGAESPNYQSLRWFIDHALPPLAAALPGLRLTVAGRQVGALPPIQGTLADRIDWLGEVEDLAPLFAAARLFVAPTRLAGGLPHKVQNAAAHGLPAVVTPVLAEQLREPDGTVFPAVARDWSADAFVEALLGLYTDPAAWSAARERGLAHVAAACDPAAFDALVAEIARG
jgi:GT2 family glycosyltransferase